jgi:hypothetical protein
MAMWAKIIANDRFLEKAKKKPPPILRPRPQVLPIREIVD